MEELCSLSAFLIQRRHLSKGAFTYWWLLLIKLNLGSEKSYAISEIKQLLNNHPLVNWDFQQL